MRISDWSSDVCSPDLDAVGDSEDVPSIWVVIGRCLSWPTIRNMLFGATIANMVSLSLNAFLAAYLIRRFGYTLVEAGWVVGLVASLPDTLCIVRSEKRSVGEE